jgi:hypothetical protein
VLVAVETLADSVFVENCCPKRTDLTLTLAKKINANVLLLTFMA